MNIGREKVRGGEGREKESGEIRRRIDGGGGEGKGREGGAG